MSLALSRRNVSTEKTAGETECLWSSGDSQTCCRETVSIWAWWRLIYSVFRNIQTRSVHKNKTVHVNYEGISYSRTAAQLNCWQSSSAQQNQQHLIRSFWSNKLSRLLLKYIKLHIIYLYSDIWTYLTSVSSADRLDPVVNHGVASLLIVQDHFQWDPALSGVKGLISELKTELYNLLQWHCSLRA